jgi:subtilisin family serine protease
MQKLRVLVAATLVVLVACQEPNPPTTSDGSALAAVATGDTNVIVLLKREYAPGRHGLNKARAEQVARGLGLAPSYSYGTALFGFAASVPRGRLAALQRDPRVELVSADGYVEAVAQTLPTGVNRIEGDVSSTAAGNGSGSVDVSVAILDTGIDIDHPDLNVLGGVNCSTGRSFDDGNGHGSHTAGTVGARDDGNGVVGVAPGARLYAVRVLNNAGSGSWASVACGIDWVTANAASLGIEVANMSLGGSGSDGACSSDALHLAICNSVAAGVTYVVSAGNSNADLAGSVPAAFNEVLTVTAMADFNGQPGGGAAATCRSDVDETPADFSNWTTKNSADEGHTIAGPGVCILSTWKGGVYKTISGTSMSSPHVAGVAALCIASGKCTGEPSAIIAKLRSDAAARPASYGFAGDPNNPITTGGRTPKTLYYGHLVYAGGY